MISCKLEQIGDRLALVLDEADAQALKAHVGDTVRLELVGEGGLLIVERETWTEDSHARGRAFLRRYHRTFEQLG